MQFLKPYCSIFVVLLALGACTSSDPLAGSEWRLLEFQSMDDSIGTLRPETSQQFTMRLNADGTMSLQLDCNRANGSWSHVPSEGGENGSFSIGPLAATRALCSPPNFDERIVRDAEYVRSYLLHDGRLYLSLMADAGIYAWESTGAN
jgi:heat shock protein HslJ